MFRLDGRVAVITGAASGIGAATARLFAQAGADIVLGWFDGDPHDPRPVAEDVRDRYGRRSAVVQADMRRGADAEALIAAAVDELGRVDIVVANAGITRTRPLAQLDDGAMLEMLEVDLLGALRCFRAAVPHMRSAGWGRLLATSSIAGAVQGWPDHAHYTAAKAGLVGLVRSLALELAPDGITANCVAPGVIESPQTEDPVNSLGPDGLREFASRVPCRRNGRPEDIAGAFLYLASDAASFVQGQVLTVDGGVSLSLV